MIRPPYLKAGDTVGMLCPAGYMPAEKAESAVNVFREWGFKVITGITFGKQNNYFSGTDDERLSDLQDMMDDKNIKAIFCIRGGYGTSRIIDRIDFKKFRKHPKWIIGFSDITVLHSHLYTNFKIASMHAPMASAFNDGQYANEFVQSLHEALLGKKGFIEWATHPFNKPGTVKGTLVGGNLSLLVHLIGTSSEIDTDDKILFIEDIGEYIYNIDRMLYQLKRSGKFNHLKALVIGGFTQMKDTEIPFGQPVEEVLRDVLSEYDFPVCFSFPVSHEKENYALKVGMKYRLTIKEDKTLLKEL